MCKLINGTSKNLVLQGISKFTKSFSNLLNYSCPYRVVSRHTGKSTLLIKK